MEPTEPRDRREKLASEPVAKRENEVSRDLWDPKDNKVFKDSRERKENPTQES